MTPASASRESSKPEEPAGPVVAEPAEFFAFVQEHPIELPQFRHPRPGSGSDTHETLEKQGDRDSDATFADVSGVAPSTPAFPGVPDVGTLRDESPDAVEAALARTLDAATAAGKWDVVERILAQLEARRHGT